MRARAALFHHLQAFFETQLQGAYRYDEARPHVPQDAEKLPGRSRYAYGRVKEIVEADFGPFSIKLESPNETPPLGRVELRLHGRNVVSGPLEPGTFARAGAAVKQLERTTE